MVSLTRDQWVALGREIIEEVLDTHIAAPLVEIEARVCAKPWRDNPRPIDPHLLTVARRELLDAGRITETTASTRGGGDVTIFHQPIVRGRGRLIADTAARKRLLIARWKSWARGSQHMPNLIGTGGETVVHNSLRAAAPHGYALIQPTSGEVSSLFGVPVPGGPLDNGAWLITVDPRTQAPSSAVLVPIEVKNVRHWLYPNHWETYQLLHKAAGLANASPEYPVLPILICRKAHYRTMQLAKDLGFLIFQTHDQYVLPSERIRADRFEEVRTELGFDDLVLTDSPNSALVTWLSGAVHREARRSADRWHNFGRHQIASYAQLRDERLRWHQRLAVLEALHETAAEALGSVGGWAPSPDDGHM